jgi:long-chain acyl-CoA synthetase
MNICEHLTVTARLFPNREAITFEGSSFTYAQLDQMSDAAAHRLIEAGIRPGDRVAIMLPNVPAFVVWYYATLRIGAVAVSISTRLAPSEVAFLVDDCQAKAFVSSSSTVATLLSDLPQCVAKSFSASDLGDQCDGQSLNPKHPTRSQWAVTDPNDAAVILYTSGTTGFAKGATLSHLNVRSNVHAFNHLCNMQPDDRILLSVPLFHCFGQNALLNSAFNVGATLVLQRQFDLTQAKHLLAEQQVTQLYGVPMMFQLLLDSCDRSDLSSVNYCFAAAATLPIQTANRWREKFGIPINEGYGLTETSPFASYNHRLQFVPGSIGTPIDLVEMKIVDTETGQTCEPDELGEIAIRGPNVMLGYWNRETETKNAIRDGWFHSGDIGRVDQRGYFYIVDRVKDMIAVGGLKVYPAEVERVLLDHADVAQVAVVGFPDEVFGEQVVAFLVPANGTAASEALVNAVKQHAKDNLANYKVPRKLIALEELPRNPSGKILKTKLREFDLPANTELAGDDQVETVDRVENGQLIANHVRPPTLRNQLAVTHAANRTRAANAFVQQLVQEISDAEELPAIDARFLDCGLDSLMIVEMSSQIQVELGSGHEAPATLLFDHPRISDLGNYLVGVLYPDDSSRGSADPMPTAPMPIAPMPTAANTGPTQNKFYASQHQEIESMTEEQALAELIKELDS